MNTTELIVKEINGMEGKLSEALPAHIPSKKFIRTALMAVQMSPDLIKADRHSLYVACIKAATDGLILDGRQAALVTFGGKVQYMPMVAGIIQKVRNTGHLTSISAHIVYEKDKFRHIKAPIETVEHEEGVGLDQDPGKPIGVYAVAVLKSGERQYCVMRKAEVMKVRGVAKTKNIWDGPFGLEKWKVTAIRRLCKWLPSSSELDSVFAHDNEHYDFEQANVTPPEPAEPEADKGGTRASRAILAQEEPEIDVDDEMQPGDPF